MITITDETLIQSNQAQAGGAIYSITGTVTVDGDSCLQNNVAVLTGGGIHAGDDVQINLGGPGAANRAFLVANRAGNGGGVYMEQNSGFDGQQVRFFGNTTNFPTVGGAWLSLGGSQTRSCVSCCIVGNGDLGVGQTINGNVSTWSGNWWGSDFGPYVSGAGAGTASGTSTGDSAGDVDPFFFSATGTTGSAVNIGFVTLPDDYGNDSTGGDSDWLRIADGDVPSDCVNDTCEPTSAISGGRPARACTYVK